MSNTNYFPEIFATGVLNGDTLKNRMVVAPLTRTSATEKGEPTPQMADYYSLFAKHGWGLIISEATYIDTAFSQGYFNQPGISTKAQIDAWRNVVNAVHENGGKILLQLCHAGALCQGNIWASETIAPSPVLPVGEQSSRYKGEGPFPMPREITHDEIRSVINAFSSAAKNAIRAGFDGVEIHGANGYLLDQFLSDGTNLRKDEYGGSIENRFRLHIEVMRAVRAAVPMDKILGVRISQSKTNDHTHVWKDGVNDAKYIFRKLGEIEQIYIHVSAHLGCAPVFGTDVSLAGLAKKLSNHPVIANGKLHDPVEAERIISKGEADFASIGKGALADPKWPEKVARGDTPLPFTPDMVTPYANLDNVAEWRRRNPDYE